MSHKDPHAIFFLSSLPEKTLPIATMAQAGAESQGSQSCKRQEVSKCLSALKMHPQLLAEGHLEAGTCSGIATLRVSSGEHPYTEGRAQAEGLIQVPAGSTQLLETGIVLLI